MGRMLDRFINQKILARWRRFGQQVDLTPLSALRKQRDDARQLRQRLDHLIQKADGRLVRPLVGSSQISKPIGTDWSWRPDVWREPLAQPGLAPAQRKASLDAQVALFHDCDLAQIGLRQLRNRRDRDLAPYSLAIEVFEFAGSFLSVAIELPAEGTNSLTRQHLIRVGALIESEQPVGIFARLNIQHGPNTEQVLRGFDCTDRGATVDFDLAHLNLNERRIEKLWLDLIFDNPAMNRVVLRDLTFCRHHRADL